MQKGLTRADERFMSYHEGAHLATSCQVID